MIVININYKFNVINLVDFGLNVRGAFLMQRFSGLALLGMLWVIKRTGIGCGVIHHLKMPTMLLS